MSQFPTSTQGRSAGGFWNTGFGNAMRTMADPGGIFRAPTVADWQQFNPAVSSFQVGEDDTYRFDRMAEGAQGRAAPGFDAAQIDPYGDQLWRFRQEGLYETMRDRALGNVPSVADARMQQNLDRVASDASSLARSDARVSPAEAMRLAMNAQANAGQQIAGEANVQRLAEQMAAEQALANYMQQQRAADVGLATTQAQLDQDAAARNALLEQNQTGLNDALMLNLYNQGFGRDVTQQQAMADRERIRAGQNTAAAGVAQGDAQRIDQKRAGIVGAVGGALGAILSDERSKENVTDADDEVDAMLAALSPKRWDYKAEHGGEKDHVGFIAQDLERSTAGRTLLRERGDGLLEVDANRGIMAALASAARLDKRIAKLEGAAG